MIKEFIIISTFSSIFSPPHKVSHWRLVFNEEFTGHSLNTDLWEVQTGCSEAFGSGNLQCYLDGTNNLNVSNGLLTITSRIENYEDKNFTSGRIHTYSSEGYLYGYFLIRAKLPKGKLLWPALWLLARPTEPECYHEIDMMEAQGQLPGRILFTAHYGLNFGNLTKQGSKNVTGLDLANEFHNFGILWTKESLGWYIDNKLYYEVPLDRETWLTDGKHQCEYDPFSQPMNITLNMGVGGNLFSDNNLSPEEAAEEWSKPTFEIDWIRIFQMYDPKKNKNPDSNGNGNDITDNFIVSPDLKYKEQFVNSLF